MQNLHKLYYKDYFSGVKFEVKQEKIVVSDTNQILINNKKLINSGILTVPKNAQMHPHCFSLKTLYPGLITGVGIEHAAGIEGELKLGIHFDYTTGAPIIYGSSVKGVLSTYTQDFLMEKGYAKEEAACFVRDIFEGVACLSNTRRCEPKPICQRDVFFDAVILSVNRDKKMLAQDTLAPHGNNPLKDPTPISFLKIAAGVSLEFRFRLCESKVAGQILTIEDKLKLFQNILTTVGIGAKTNVGYGQLEVI